MYSLPAAPSSYRLSPSAISPLCVSACYPCLGPGSTFQAWHVPSLTPVSLTAIPRRLLNHTPLREALENELRVSREISHSHALALLEVVEEHAWVFVVREACRSVWKGNTQHATQCVWAVLGLIRELEKKGWAHWNLRKESIVEGMDGKPRITGLGYCKRIKDLESGDIPYGDLYYSAPEVNIKINPSSSKIRRIKEECLHSLLSQTPITKQAQISKLRSVL